MGLYYKTWGRVNLTKMEFTLSILDVLASGLGAFFRKRVNAMDSCVQTAGDIYSWSTACACLLRAASASLIRIKPPSKAQTLAA